MSEEPKKLKPVKGKASKEYFKKRQSFVFLSRIQVAERIGCSVKTLIRWEKERRLNPYRFAHNLLRYRLEDVIALEQEARS